MGSIYCDTAFDVNLGKLGMLAVREEHTRKGLGNLLVSCAENKSKESGCIQMRLELLIPRDYEHPYKKFLHEWYTKVGYVKG